MGLLLIPHPRGVKRVRKVFRSIWEKDKLTHTAKYVQFLSELRTYKNLGIRSPWLAFSCFVFIEKQMSIPDKGCLGQAFSTPVYTHKWAELSKKRPKLYIHNSYIYLHQNTYKYAPFIYTYKRTSIQGVKKTERV